MDTRSNKPYAASCDENREVILQVIESLFARCSQVLEIGSGTGQHASYFSQHMSHLTWIASDRIDNHPGIRLWLEEARLENIVGPLCLDVTQPDWPVAQVDGVFSANTAHIMGWPAVQKMFAGIGRVLAPGGVFALYGPFNYHGRYTSDSNARFDAWLKTRDPASGIRDFEALQRLAEQAGLVLQQNVTMPANNRILCWKKPA